MRDIIRCDNCQTTSDNSVLGDWCEYAPIFLAEVDKEPHKKQFCCMKCLLAWVNRFLTGE